MALPGHEVVMFIKDFLDRNMQEQPAGVDLRLQKVFKFKSAASFSFSGKTVSIVEEIPAKGGGWELRPGSYKIRFAEVVHVPTDCIGLCLPRSSLLRSGVDVRCALWDPGYYGRGEALLIVNNPHGVRLEPDSRIAQIFFIRLAGNPRRTYEGSYLGENLE
jgi:dUTP pyrophosphatase